MRTSTLFVEKTSDFSKFMVCSHGHSDRVLSQCRKGEGVNFSRFCADVFYGRSLIVLVKQLSSYLTIVPHRVGIVLPYTKKLGSHSHLVVVLGL